MISLAIRKPIVVLFSLFVPVLFLIVTGVRAQVPPADTDWTDPSPHQVRSVAVASDVELEVLDWGGDGDPLVFLHGMSMNAHVFDDFAPRFTNTHRVVGITRRGHGASSWPDSGYSTQRRVNDIRIVLDSLGLERVIFAGHSLAGEEMTHFATQYPGRVEGLVYIDAAHDLTLIEQLRIPQICSLGPEVLEAIERRFKNPEAFRHTQQRKGDDGSRLPYVSRSAIAQINEAKSRPDYTAVRAPALAVYHMPRRVEDNFGGVALSEECVSAFQRYIYEGIAGFAVGMERSRIVALDDSQHNIHLVSPDALEEAMRRWLAEQREAQQEESSFESKFVNTGDVRLHFLDFGGEGLPLVLVHSEAWDANTYKNFGTRFNGQNWVLAVTRPGYGKSEGSSYDVPSQGESLVDFLDALSINRAVFAGNASASRELTYLAENYPDRVAGVIYFTGLAVPWIDAHESDSTRAFEMFMRASPDNSPDVADRVRARRAYQPRFLRSDEPTITVAGLAFVARSGTMGHERGIGALALVGSPLMSEVRTQMPPSPVRDHLEKLATDEAYRFQQLNQIQDSVAREYFLRLATDDSLQAEVYQYHENVILPAKITAQKQFAQAFGDNLRLVRLDIPQVIGYEYRDSPELIVPHIQDFLEEVSQKRKN